MSSLPLFLALLPDFGGGEMLLVMFVVLLLFGPDKLPQLAKGMGRAFREFKKAASEVEREIKRAIDEVPDSPKLDTLFPPEKTVPKTLPAPSSAAARPAAPAPDAPAPFAPATPPSSTPPAPPTPPDPAPPPAV